MCEQPDSGDEEIKCGGIRNRAMGPCMTNITIRLSIKELELLTTLASDQLFRREFIDPKMPGHKPDFGEISLGKALVSRLRSLLDPRAARGARPARIAR